LFPSDIFTLDIISSREHDKEKYRDKVVQLGHLVNMIRTDDQEMGGSQMDATALSDDALIRKVLTVFSQKRL
jgi:hypothetical protein